MSFLELGLFLTSKKRIIAHPTIIYTSDMLKIVERAYIVFNGEILFAGSSRELVSDPKAREVYLGDQFLNPFGEE